jgi:ATPase subunit of ABC transporter with duplicated ATPase domains
LLNIIGYYEQSGLVLTAEQEKMPVLKFVQEECEKSSSSDKSYSASDSAPKLAVTIEDPSTMGRRKKIAGSEGSINVEVVSQFSESMAFSERDAMSLLTRFQFPSKRWYDRIGQLSGGERRRLQLLQILAAKPNVLLLDEPSNDLDLRYIIVFYNTIIILMGFFSIYFLLS